VPKKGLVVEVNGTGGDRGLARWRDAEKEDVRAVMVSWGDYGSGSMAVLRPDDGGEEFTIPVQYVVPAAPSRVDEKVYALEGSWRGEILITVEQNGIIWTVTKDKQAFDNISADRLVKFDDSVQ
jgi:hypothetical protein